MKSVLLTLVASSLLVASLAVPSGAKSADSPPSGRVSAEIPNNDGLVVQEASNDRFEGVFAADNREPVAFSARRDQGQRAIVELRVGDKTFTARFDLKAEVAVWGGGGFSVDESVRDSLLAFVAAGSRIFAAAPSHTAPDLAKRLATLVADAPLGMRIPDSVVAVKGVETFADPGPVEEDDIDVQSNLSHVDTGECIAALGELGVSSETAAAACQQSHEEGIRCMSCATGLRWIHHDANSHCLIAELVSSGPDSSGCLGRCGPGCAATGWGVFTYDCGDHDRCGRVHGGSWNPWDQECGDEYFEADDDALWGTCQCF